VLFPDIVKDCRKMRNLPKIFLRSFENVGFVGPEVEHGLVSVLVQCSA